MEQIDWSKGKRLSDALRALANTMTAKELKDTVEYIDKNKSDKEFEK